jgi:hypothetical protein
MCVRMLGLLLCFMTILGAEVIDRILISIGAQVITESELKREIRITAFLNNDALEFSPEVKRQAANRLIEQKLVRKELELTRYPAPEAAEVEGMFGSVRKMRVKNPEQLPEELNRYGLTEQDLRDHLLWQMTLIRFTGLRFRPGVQVTEEEIKEYFRKEILPKADSNSADRFEDYREQIEETLTSKRVEQELDEWLKQARQQVQIKYLDTELQ